MSDKDSWSAGSDKSRRRRLVKNYSSCSPSIRPKIDSISIDVDSLTVLSCPQAVYHAVCSFDSRKRAIVDSIGFGGIICMPSIVNVNKKFALWLYKQIDSRTRSLSFGDNFSITITQEHVGKVSGLTYTGDDIADNSFETVGEKMYFKSTNLAFLGSKVAIVEAAEKFVLEDFPCVLTEELTDQFKIAFVIFVMGRFLAPCNDHADGNTNFWGALQDPSKISSYNWSSFVLSNILDAASTLNWVVAPKRTMSSLAGCPLILQIFYLDNIDFGVLNKPHGMLPRWQMFSNDSISAMIEADRIVTPTVGSFTEYGKTKMIREGQSCYSFGNHQSIISANIGFKWPTTSAPGHCSSEQTSTPDHSGPESSIRLTDSWPLPTMMKNAPNIDKDVIDFGVFIRNKYQGKVDSKLLDDLKLHNARCLQHLSKFYRSLAADIVEENTKLAIKIIENHSSLSPNDIAHPTIGAPTPRRRRYNDLFNGTDSSTEGEDNMMQSKSSRTRVRAQSMHHTFSLDNNSSPMLDMHTQMTQKNNSLTRQTNTDVKKAASVTIPSPIALPAGTNTVPSVTTTSPVDIDLPGATIAYSMPSLDHSLPPSSTSIARDIDGAYKFPACNLPLRSFTPVKGRNKSHTTNSGAFYTPDASIKMGFCSPNISPTTEIQTYSGGCLSLRMLDSIHGIDLNASTFEEEYNINSEPKKRISPGPLSLSHWEMNLSLPQIEPLVYNQFFNWLATTSNTELESEWIVHYIPRFLKISGTQLKEQFVLRKPMSLDTFDVAIRRFRQLDNLLYPSDIPLRWRHFLESDYAMHALGHENPVENKSIRDQFVGTIADFEVSRCRMFYVPVYVQCKWWCYAWDMKTGVVFIIDPSNRNATNAAVINKHSGTIKLLSKCLEATAKDLFSGWSPNFSSCHPSVLQIVGFDDDRFDSGILTLFCMTHFNGREIVVHPDEENMNEFISYFLYQLLGILNNGGRKPSGLTHPV